MYEIFFLFFLFLSLHSFLTLFPLCFSPLSFPPQGLGINPEERKILIKEVNIILHCAASIDFKAPMDLSVDQNVNGALRVLELAKECENLDVMNHVSTAYTGCHKVCKPSF